LKFFHKIAVIHEKFLLSLLINLLRVPNIRRSRVANPRVVYPWFKKCTKIWIYCSLRFSPNHILPATSAPPLR